jgi:hypothetical protein
MKDAVRKESGPQKICVEHGGQHGSMIAKTCVARTVKGKLTAVMLSMQSTNASRVKYRLSLKLYSFHSCPNRSCLPPMRSKFHAK